MEIFGKVLKEICFLGAGVCFAILFLAVILTPVWDKLREWFSQPIIEKTLAAVFVVGFILYGGSKGGYSGHITYDGGIKASSTPNLVTNDTITISWQRDIASGIYVPDSAAVYIDYRAVGATNTEWGLLAQSVVGAWTWTGTLENATNFDYNVWAYYIPPEPVHTNGVWVYKTLKDRENRYPIPLRARVEVNGKAIATPKEKRKDEEQED